MLYFYSVSSITSPFRLLIFLQNNCRLKSRPSLPAHDPTDVNGNVNEWNNKTAEITGFTKEEAFDNPLVTTFIVPSLRQSVQEVLENALRGIETSNYELEFETKSKEIRYLLVNATTRRDAENNIVGVVGVAQDG